MTVIRDDVLNNISDPRLKVFVIWEPILPKDSFDAVEDATAILKDEWRARQFWDPLAESGKRIKKLLGLEIANPAWDIYMLYPPGVKWRDATPKPEYWMHQITFKPGGNDERRFGAQRLDTKRLREEIERRLK